MFRSKKTVCLFPGCLVFIFCMFFHWSTNVEESTSLSISSDKISTIELSNDIELEVYNECLEKAIKISRMYNFLFFTLINKAYFNLTNNWLCNTVLMTGVHDRVLIVTTDLESKEMLQKFWPNVAFVHYNSTYQYNKKLNWGEKNYIHFLTLRAQFLANFVEANLTFVLFETDALWLKNPVKMFLNFTQKSREQKAFDVVVPVKFKTDEFGRDLTFDPMLVIPSSKTKQFFRQMASMLLADPNLYDQDVFDDLCKTNYSQVSCGRFAYMDISDGYWFDLSPKYRKQFDSYIVNNNYYVGVDHKITRQALNGFWYLKPKEKTCDFVMIEHKFTNERIKY